MNIFAGLQVYGGNWNVVGNRDFSQKEINMIDKAEVVSSEYGKSVCFLMKSGGRTYIPLSRDASAGVGDSIDLTKAKILTLHKDGSDDITRIDI